MKKMLPNIMTRTGWLMLFGALLVAPSAGFAQKDGRSVLLVVNEIKEEAVSFAVRGYRAADASIAKVELLGEQKLRIMGIKEGSTDLQVTGDGEATALIKITVRANIQAVLDAVRQDLDNLPEVEAAVSLGKVVLRGEITKPEHWRFLHKTVLPEYGRQVSSKVTFRPQPELLLRLKSDLEKAKFKVLESGADTSGQADVLSLAVSGNNLHIGGNVYARSRQDLVNSIIAAQHWLDFKKDGKAADDDKDCYAIVNVNVIPTMLELDVAFVGVTEREEELIGANIAKAGLLFIEAAADVGGKYVRSDGTTHSGKASYLVGTSLNGTMQFFAGSGPGRFKSLGHMAFKNEAPEWKTFQSGGTLKIRVTGRDVADLKDIDYGLILKAKGGLSDGENAALDLDLELSTPIPVGQDYDLKRNRLNSTVLCPLGKTFIMAGTKELFEGINKEGVPFLRNIPLLSFFFSEKGSKLENRKLLIMISPQLARAPEAAAPAVEQTIGTVQEADKPVTNLQKKSLR